MITKPGLALASQPLSFPLLTATTVRNDEVGILISAPLSFRIPDIPPAPAFLTLDRIILAAVEVHGNGKGEENQEKHNPDDVFCLQRFLVHTNLP
jgi:hypothetical protein